MTDWSLDPVFGDVAMRFAPRGTWGPLVPRLFDGVSVSARFGHLSLEERDELLALDPALTLSDAQSTNHAVHFKQRDWLMQLSDRRPYAAALLAAADNARAQPFPPRWMGIVNVTPDSFSDGGSFVDAARAIDHGRRLVADGADLIDVGGESTRPGAQPVDEAEELRRVLPVVQSLAAHVRVPISIDTMKPRVAEKALAAGATIVNDVSAGRFDERMFDVVARARAGYVAMHMLGTPRDMQTEPRYDDVVGEVLEFLRARCRAALEAGVDRSKLWIDPGIGFGKTLDHNLDLLRGLDALRSLGLPLVLGVSRKSFIATIEERVGLTRSDPSDRMGGTLAALVFAMKSGPPDVLRVHDVREARQAAHVARALSPVPEPLDDE